MFPQVHGVASSVYLISEKDPVKSDQVFSSDQYFSPTNDFTGLKLTPTKNFYQSFFLVNKNQITKTLKKNWYHNLVEMHW